jgi:hypothetical protein
LSYSPTISTATDTSIIRFCADRLSWLLSWMGEFVPLESTDAFFLESWSSISSSNSFSQSSFFCLEVRVWFGSTDWAIWFFISFFHIALLIQKKLIPLQP